MSTVFHFAFNSFVFFVILTQTPRRRMSGWRACKQLGAMLYVAYIERKKQQIQYLGYDESFFIISIQMNTNRNIPSLLLVWLKPIKL